MSETEYLTSTEAAHELGISRPTLTQWVDRGIIRAQRPNPEGWRRFTREEVERVKAGK